MGSRRCRSWLGVDTAVKRERDYGGCTKYYKQQGTKSELIEVCYYGGRACLGGAQVANWSGIPGVTGWSENPLSQKKNGWYQSAAVLLGILAGRQAKRSRSGARILNSLAMNCKPLCGPANFAWDRLSRGKSMARSSPQGAAWVCALGVHKVWSFRAQSHTWDGWDQTWAGEYGVTGEQEDKSD